MNLIFNDEYSGKFISPEKKTTIKDEIGKAREVLYSREGAGSDFLGWIDHPVNYDKEEFGRISAAAEKIKKICDVFVVIGIGGSYLGARAALEFVKSPLYNQLPKDTPDIYFAGRDLSPASLSELLTLCEGKDICVNVISKSGTTTEPAIAFRVFRQLLEKKYGMDGAKERIFVTTDKVKGALKELANEKGYETFVVPDDIGGRYSVLSAVGLLPIAVAGIDIKEMMDGARAAREVYGSAPYEENDCLKYVAARNLLYRSGKAIEIFVTYDSALILFAEWWKQLFGESEGKDGVSLYPSSVNFTTDLHSLGQYIQQGTRNIFETVLCIEDDNCSISVPADEDGRDGMNYLAGKTLSEINRTAMKATLLAHVDGGVPNLMISLKDRSAYTFGWAVYFFELACGISGYTLGVNPFNQPGVEDYKKNMYALLGKPGEENEARRKELLNRIK